jgi:amidase
MNSIVSLSASELSRLIFQRELSCRQVMVAYLDHIDRYNDLVNAIVSKKRNEVLLAEADLLDNRLRQGEYLGWMTGFPIAVKDLAATAGIPTTLGSPIFRNHIPTEDAIIVQRMRRNGAIIIGKTNIPEFGLGSQTYNSVFGRSRNAYDLTKTCGGSSGGAAAALALRMLPVADGSDMGGSLRNPAAWNNVYGFRPSWGVVPSGPGKDLFMDQFSTEGPMARNAEDIIGLFDVMSGSDDRAPLSRDPVGKQPCDSSSRGFRGLRLGWLGNMGGHIHIDEGLMRAYRESLKRFTTDLGCRVSEVVPEFDMQSLWKCWTDLRSFVVQGKLGSLYGDSIKRKELKPEAIWEIERGLKLTATEIYSASETRSAWYCEMRRLFSEFDFLLLPSTQVAPFSVDTDWPSDINGHKLDSYHRWMEVVIGPTLAGLPVLNIPVGFDKDRLPLGLQLIGKRNSDYSVLQFGRAWDDVTPFKDIVPDILLSRGPPPLK